MTDPRLEQALADSGIGDMPPDMDANAIAATPAGASLLADAAVGAAIGPHLVALVYHLQDVKHPPKCPMSKDGYGCLCGLSPALDTIEATIAEALDHDE